MIKISTIVSAAAPLIALSTGMVLGVQFNFVSPKLRGREYLPIIIFAAVAGIVFLLVGPLRSSFSSVYLLDDYISFLEAQSYPAIKYNALVVVTVSLIGLFELGYASGFGLAAKIFATRTNSSSQTPTSNLATEKSKPANTNESQTKFNSKAGTTFQAATLTVNKTSNVSEHDEQGLRRDEQTIMELFLYGKVTQIVPLVNVNKPEGYIYEGIPQLDWDTKRARQALDSLVRRGYLNAELTDKILSCKACGSSNIRIRKTCPECHSLRLKRENLLEHFACGAVERQSAFETENGDLVCPKCKAKLHLIGSDYRSLPPAYLCLGCNTLNSEPLLNAKCGSCGSTAAVDEEPEVFLYKYTANSEFPLQELQQIKPLETCIKFFRTLGYSIVAPAFVSGRSGTQHLFDILILGRVGWVEPSNGVSPRNDNGNTVVEVLISSKPVEVPELTRIYGKISDIDCDFLMFVIPGLTPDARNYAAAYHMKVSEGRNIEEALANSKIPKANADKEDK